ncbi:MAG: TetR/AcrR family transcriptional regulator [Acholeplasmataceae bacterium]|jgi:AcrR family transcriptional regulator|nr:TetR/AcrR family transcriptional regulator [Acholeplasmataceae bacterium]
MPKETFINLKPDKKQKIIDATIKELSIHPYEHINLANIIRDAQIPRGSFYQYFENKDDLYLFFTSYISEKKAEMFKDVFDMTTEMTFIMRFKKIFLRGFEFAHAYPKLVQAGYYMTQSPLFRESKLYQASYEAGIKFFEQMIKRDQDKGIIRDEVDARMLASAILEYMNKLNLDFYMNPSESLDTIEAKADFVFDILEKGIIKHV